MHLLRMMPGGGRKFGEPQRYSMVEVQAMVKPVKSLTMLANVTSRRKSSPTIDRA